MRPCSVSENGKAMMEFGESNAPLMQFTGLHDKNGKEIYEGDIVEDPDSREHYEVLYRGDRFMVERRLTDPQNPGYELADLCHICEEVSVIANIHESPELLR